jgi:hypothetical protein
MAFTLPEAERMGQNSAIAVWDSWVAAQHYKTNRSVPDREMLESLFGE